MIAGSGSSYQTVRTVKFTTAGKYNYIHESGFITDQVVMQYIYINRNSHAYARENR